MFRPLPIATIVFSMFLANAVTAQDPAKVLSGGVGLESRDEMKRVYEDYNLHLGFAEKEGAFLSGVDVTLHDRKGDVVWSGPTEGPFLYAKLPPGRYTVTANFSGKPIKRTVEVKEKAGPMQYLRW